MQTSMHVNWWIKYVIDINIYHYVGRYTTVLPMSYQYYQYHTSNKIPQTTAGYLPNWFNLDNIMKEFADLGNSAQIFSRQEWEHLDKNFWRKVSDMRGSMHSGERLSTITRVSGIDGLRRRWMSADTRRENRDPPGSSPVHRWDPLSLVQSMDQLSTACQRLFTIAS
jgi:hypothetical protein